MDIENILRSIQPFVIMFAALFAAFLTAVWISVVIWAFRDIRARSRDVFAQILATLMVLIFFPLFPFPGLILYLLLRPRETLAEVYERSLEEEALLQGIEERMACPGCNRRIEEGFMICPTCHTRLKKACVSCGRLLHLRWNICPYCAAVQTAAKAPVPAPAIALETEPVSMLGGGAASSLPEWAATAPAAESPAVEGPAAVDPAAETGPEPAWEGELPQADDETWIMEAGAEPGPEAESGPGPGAEPGPEDEAEPKSGPEAETLPFEFE
jgi:RNA polymerase subunit RPABC4/transcription elongation factor Spt4